MSDSFVTQKKTSTFAARMDTSGLYKIDFRDLTADEMTRTWILDDSFFSVLDEQDIKHGKLTATLRVKKKAGSYQLEIHAIGEVEIPCDRCLEPMSQPIDAEDTIEVRLSEAYDDDGDRILIPEDKPILDVSWNLYETIALAIPIFHTHNDGECPENISQYLITDDEPARDSSEDGMQEEKPIDTRWEALKALLPKS